MNELTKVTEFLLLNRDSLVVPGLGAFKAGWYTPQWLEDEELFLPPVRHVHFDPNIFQDTEEVFVKCIEKVYKTTHEKAICLCDSMVSEFHRQLIIDGSADFGSIGLFTMQEDAEITMAPYECGIATPENYGFDALHFPLLANLPAKETENTAQLDDKQAEVSTSISQNPEDNEATNSESNTAEPQVVMMPKPHTYEADSKHIIIRLNRAFVHYTMVIAASVLLFFLLSPTIMNEQTTKSVQQATTNYFPTCPSLYATQSDDCENTVEVPEGNETDTESAEEEIAVEPEEAATEPTEVESNEVEEQFPEVAEVQPDNTSSLRGQYCIVLASAISKTNAEAFVNRLQKQDINAVIYDNGKLLRVVIDGFETEAEAYNQNASIHKLGEKFRSTWVMKI